MILYVRRRVLACAPFRSNRPIQKSNNRPAINVTSVPVIGYASRVDSLSLSFSLSVSSRWRSNYSVKIADVIGSGRSTSVITGNRMIEVRGEVLAGRKEQFTCWERDVVHALEQLSREIESDNVRYRGEGEDQRLSRHRNGREHINSTIDLDKRHLDSFQFATRLKLIACSIVLDKTCTLSVRKADTTGIITSTTMWQLQFNGFFINELAH